MKDLIYCWLLLDPFPEFYVANGLTDSYKAGVDECLDLLRCRSCASPPFHSNQQDRFHSGVKDPDDQVRHGSNVIHLKEGCPRSADSHFHISVSPPLFINNAA